MRQTKIGLVNHESMSGELITYAFLGQSDFTLINVPSTEHQVAFIRDNQLQGLVMLLPRFTERGYQSLLKISELVSGIPIVVVSDQVDAVVKANLGFMGRIDHADYNEELGEIAPRLGALMNKDEVITRSFLRHPMKKSTQMSFEGQTEEVWLQDLSLRGARVRAPAYFEKEDSFVMALPRKQQPPVFVNCQVLNIYDEDGDQSQELIDRKTVGVQFTSLAKIDLG